MLRCDLVTGRQMFGKTETRLGVRYEILDRESWGSVMVFPAIVSQRLFEAAQRRLCELSGARGRTNTELITDIGNLFEMYGRLSAALIDGARGMACARAYEARFGTLAEAYRQVGFVRPRLARGTDENGDPLSREGILDGLRRLHSEQGVINVTRLQSDRRLPSIHVLRVTFGSIGAAYAAAGVSCR